MLWVHCGFRVSGGGARQTLSKYKRIQDKWEWVGASLVSICGKAENQLGTGAEQESLMVVGPDTGH